MPSGYTESRLSVLFETKVTSAFFVKKRLLSPIAVSDALSSSSFFLQLAQPDWASELFDGIPDTVYFVKDSIGRYLSVNETLVRRLGLSHKSDLVGKTAQELFPSPLGEDFTKQDLDLLAGGPEISNQLELHLYPSGESGWCLTWKHVLRNQDGEAIGLAGISRDLATSSNEAQDLENIATVTTYIRDHLASPLTLGELSVATNLSPFQIGQRIKRLYNLTPRQYITRSRIEAACHLLTQTQTPLSEIALACGFSDQSAFTRQFKRSVGIPPRSYREQ